MAIVETSIILGIERVIRDPDEPITYRIYVNDTVVKEVSRLNTALLEIAGHIDRKIETGQYT